MQSSTQLLPMREKAVMTALFFGSGCAALIYEIVWFHLLRLALGATAISLTLLLISFMGGMLVGALYLHRWLKPRHNVLKVYAALEVGVAVFGLLVPLVLPLISNAYANIAVPGDSHIFLRATLSLIILLPPGILMGATIPLVAHWLKKTHGQQTDLGLFYAANVFGAIVGTLASSILLLRLFDVYVASAVAIGLNLLVALIAQGLALKSEAAPNTLTNVAREPVQQTRLTTLSIVIGISGFCALGAQVVWTRLLSLLFGGTVYTFSLILAVFLAGLGIGSAIGTRIANRVTSIDAALGLCQLLLVVAITYSAFSVQSILPYWHAVNDGEQWFYHVLDNFLRCAVAILPATVLWGCSMALALASAAQHSHRPEQTAGQVYAANAFGAILGAFICGLILIPELGTAVTQQFLAISSVTAALLIIRQHFLQYPVSRLRRPVMRYLAATVLISWAAIMALEVPPLEPALVAYGRQMAQWPNAVNYLEVNEGRAASVAISQPKGSSIKSMHVSGKVVASTWENDLRLQRMLAHYPSLMHGAPETVLIMGFGAGTSAGSFTLYDSVKRIVIVEIEPAVIASAGRHFGKENYNVLDDPRTEVVIDDARHFINTTKETFDIISIDPIHPWVKGAASLYSQEFLRRCRDRLRENGIIAHWVPLYETGTEAVKSEIATYFDVFPDAILWNSERHGKGYDMVVTGFMSPQQFNSKLLGKRLQQTAGIQRSMAEVGVNNAVDILKGYSGSHDELSAWLSDAELNTDANLRLEFLAGLHLDSIAHKAIYEDMMHYVPYPDGRFVVSRDEKVELRRWFGSKEKLQIVSQ